MEVKGTAVKSISSYVKLNYDTRYKEWFDNLDKDTQKIMMGPILPTDWYDVEKATVKPTVTMGKLFFYGDTEKAAWESGRYSAEIALKGIYKFFVKASSPSFIISRASRVFSTYYRPCSLSTASTSNNSLQLHLESNGIDKTCVVTQARIAGWIERALEISGCDNVEITFPESMTRGDRKTIFDIKW